MQFEFRVTSITKRIAAKTSVKRIEQNHVGPKALRGHGWIINAKKAMYHRVYLRTTAD